MNPCKVCGKGDEGRPQCFKGEDWCCEDHRKKILGDPARKSY